MNKEATLAEAQRLAETDLDDRLDGKVDTEDILLRLLEVAGLSYGEGYDLLAAYGWRRWHAGWVAGYDSGRPAIRKD